MKCIKCGETRESEFYPSRIRKSDYRCKKCIKEYIRPYTRAWMRNHPEVNRVNHAQWRSSHPQERREIRMRYHYKNMEAYRCQGLALKKFPIRLMCEVEGCLESGERHHDDYSKPYDIRWLCRKHHKALSRELIPL